jgi:fumarylacetoacetase
MDETHDPGRTSWVESAQGDTDFPIQNLPFGVFRGRDDEDEPAGVGIAIGDRILDVTACHDEGRFSGIAEAAAEACAAPSLNALMALGREHRVELRKQVSALLAADSPSYRVNRHLGDKILLPMAHA